MSEQHRVGESVLIHLGCGISQSMPAKVAECIIEISERQTTDAAKQKPTLYER